MGVMALAALAAPLVFCAIDCRHCGSRAVRVVKLLVTSEAEFSARVYRQVFNVIGVANGGPVAVLALNARMRGAAVRVNLFLVTFGARIIAQVFDGKRLPFLDIAQAVESVGEIPAVNTEVIGNEE
jgi:hypothetical protein